MTDQNEVPASSEETQPEIRVFVVLNPVAGTSDPETVKQAIALYCQDHHWQCDIHETQPDEDLQGLVKGALRNGVDMVIAAGGDGTVSQVVSGMLNSQVPMGILPAGTGNVLARNLTIPLDLRSALGVLGSEHSVQEMDVMEVNQKECFVLNVSVGISSLVMRNTVREEKRRFGFLAYIWHAIDSILHTDMHRFRLRIDGRSIRVVASELMIANSKFMGLQPQMGNVDIQPDDGQLDIFIVRTQAFRDYLNIFAAFLLRRKEEYDPKLYYLQSREVIEIQTERPLPAQADGEEVGTTPLAIRLIPRGLRVVVPLKVEDTTAV